MAVRKGCLGYVLSADSRCRVCCRVMWGAIRKWERFEECRVRHMRELFGFRYEASLSSEDQRLLPRLMQYASHGAEAILSGPDGYALLRDVVRSKRAYLENGNHFRVHWGKAVQGTPGWEQTREGHLRRTFETEVDRPIFFATSPVCYIDRSGEMDRIGVLKVGWSDAVAASWLGPVYTEREEAVRQQTFFMNRNPALTPPPLPGDTHEAESKSTEVVPVLRVMESTAPVATNAGSLVRLEAIAYLGVGFRYGKREVQWDDKRERIAFAEDGDVFYYTRDRKAEAKVIRKLRQWGFEPSAAESGDLLDLQAGRFQLSGGPGKRWETVLNTHFAEAAEWGWEIHDQRIGCFNLTRECEVLSELKESGDGLFDLSVDVGKGRKKLPLLPLLRDYSHSLRKARGAAESVAGDWTLAHVSEREGTYLLLPQEQILPLLEQLFELRTEEKLTAKGGLRVPRFRAVELAVSSTIPVPSNLETGRWRELMTPGVELKWQSPAQLPPSCAILRDYQKDALGWLDFLRETKTSGILADDMGLGKTLMMLAYLVFEKAHGRLDRPFMIVCPKSVLDNWQREVSERFRELELLVHSGSGRKTQLPHEWTSGQGLLTSYPVLREDQDLLAATEWSMVFFDEAQIIKNHRSQTFNAARSLRAVRKVCITGTPMENHLGELWALFELMMPDLLGGYSSFERTFRRPIESDDSATAQVTAAALARRLAPFILRRKKEDVATELPPRTEVTHWIEMSDAQQARYLSVHQRIVKKVSDVVRERGAAESQIHILEALTRLRLMCCDPRLGQYGAEAEEAGDIIDAEDSAKLQHLMVLLEELIDEGRRILVFSQFVRMLELLEPELDARGWGYLKLTGNTQNRRQLVESFEQGTAPVFLISLRAGGFGLNLTAADTVIHYDPWWNPAVEAQATDRAHRIGQHKPVFVHRLIVKNTIEARILEIHERKRAIVDSLISGLPGDRVVLDEETINWLFSETIV